MAMPKPSFFLSTWTRSLLPFAGFLLMGPLVGAAGLAAQDDAPGEYDGRTKDQWIELLDSESPDERRRACYAVGRIGPPAREAVPKLARIMNTDPNSEPRWYAAHALGRMGAAAEPAAGEIERAVREQLDRAPEQAEVLGPHVLRSAAWALGEIGAAARPQARILLEVLEQDDPVSQAAAALSLWRIVRYEGSRDFLKAMLASKDDEAAFQAAAAWIEMGDDAGVAIEQLVAALGHGGEDVRRAAAKALGNLGTPAAEAVAAALDEGAPQIDFIAAAAALTYFIDDSRESVLYRSGVSPEEFTQRWRFLTESLVPPLATRLAAPKEADRKAAGAALAHMGPAAAPRLLSALASEDESLRRAAADSLATSEAYLPPAKERSRPLAEAVASLVPALDERIRDEPTRLPAVRFFAALRLGKEGRRAEPALKAALSSPDAATRRYAAQSLDAIEAGDGER